MRPERKHLAAAVAMLFLGLGAPSLAPGHEVSGAPAQLGKVHFPVSCNAAAQKEFDLAMAYYHSFAWEYYTAPLERALQADPSCGMAHWLRALGVLDNPFTWPVPLSPKVMADGQAALEAARSAGLKTQRERDYVDALAVFYKDHDKLNHRTRAKALEDAMARGRAPLPGRQGGDDPLRAHPLGQLRPADKTVHEPAQGGEILEPIFVAAARAPGRRALPDPQLRLPADCPARDSRRRKRYSKIAPDASHAQHMPSHIFTRVGALARIGRVESRVRRRSMPAERPEHACTPTTTWSTPICSSARTAPRREVIADAQAIAKTADHFAAAYAYAAMPARLRRSSAATGRQPPNLAARRRRPTPIPWKKYPQAEAMNAFARGIGAAMSRGSGRGAGRGEAPAAAARRGDGDEDRLLGRADRHPGRSGARAGDRRRRPARRGHRDPAQGRCARGRHREARGDTRAAASGTRGARIRDPRLGHAGRRAASSSKRCSPRSPTATAPSPVRRRRPRRLATRRRPRTTRRACSS